MSSSYPGTAKPPGTSQDNAKQPNSAFRVQRLAPGCGLRLFFAALLTLGCNLDTAILHRAGSDYFPLRIGMEWTYSLPDGTTSRVVVVGDSSVQNTRASVIEQDYQRRFWRKYAGEVRSYEEYLLNINGVDYPLEQGFRLRYRLPFMLGLVWSEDRTYRVTVLGDSVFLRHELSGRVEDLARVQVPAGSFADCYQVSLTEVITRVLNHQTLGADTVSDTIYRVQWFAPGVGLVKQTGNGITQELSAYAFP